MRIVESDAGGMRTKYLVYGFNELYYKWRKKVYSCRVCMSYLLITRMLSFSYHIYINNQYEWNFLRVHVSAICLQNINLNCANLEVKKIFLQNRTLNLCILLFREGGYKKKYSKLSKILHPADNIQLYGPDRKSVV